MYIDFNSEKSGIKLCVLFITYNQKDFIERAIKSAINQKTSFEFRIVIGDDSSTDGTKEICEKYSNSYPDIIDYESNSENLGAMKNMLVTYDRIFEYNSEYIAILEGDDYWTDPFKLQKQVDYLEQNPEYGLIHTDFSLLSGIYNIHIESNNKFSKRKPQSGNVFEYLLKETSICTLTVVSKTSLIKSALNNLKYDLMKFKMGDYPLWLEISRNTKIKYLDFVSGTYRANTGSVTNSINPNNRYEFEKSTYEVKFYFLKKYIVVGKIVEEIYDNYFKFILKSSFNFNKKDLLVRDIQGKEEYLCRLFYLYYKLLSVNIIWVLSKIVYSNYQFFFIKYQNLLFRFKKRSPDNEVIVMNI